MNDEHPEPRHAGREAAQKAARNGTSDGAAGMLLRGPRSRVPATPGLRLAAALAGRPFTVARRGAGLAAELTRIGLGRSALAPAPDDPRYADPAWRANPLLRRAVQVHIAASAAAQALVGDSGLDSDDDERMRTAVRVAAAALAPSNTPLNPAAWRAAADTGGRLVTDLADLASPPRPPATARPGPFEVGTDVAATPGAVVLRTPVFELLQYLPQTESVHDVPLVVVPPLRGRYYLADLAPGRSIVEHHVRGGQQVFAISWRNPGTGHTDWDVDTYGQAVLDAMDAAEHVARTPRTSLMAFGSGGTITAMLLGHLAAIGAQQRVATVTLAATVLDRADSASDPLGWPGREAAAAHGSLHMLFWTVDRTRMPAGLHRRLSDVLRDGALAVPGAASLLGTPLDLAKVDCDCYVVAGVGDRAAAWTDVHRSARLLGGACRFVLADGGHLASLVSPPGEPGTSFRAATPSTVAATAGAPDRWIALAGTEQGSWWDDHLRWLTARTGPAHDAPPELGGRGMHALAPAPGEYVLEA
jgi:poly(3-hydroxyalkanoate) synthetase